MDHQSPRIHAAFTVLALIITTLTGCATTPHALTTPPYHAQLSQACDSITTAWLDDIDSEHELATQLLDLAAVNHKRSILLDFDSLLDSAGRPDHSLLDQLIESESTANALAREVWSQHLTRPRAHRILDDHAAAASLSPEARTSIEDQLLSNFTTITELNTRASEALLNINTRRAAVTHMMADLQRTLNATATAPAPPSLTVRPDDQALLYATMAAAIQTIHDTDIRRAAQAVLDAYVGSGAADGSGTGVPPVNRH